MLIALWGISAIIHGIAFRKFSFPKNPWPLVFMMAIYGLHLLGYSYSEHPADALREFEIKMSYMVFPIIGILINQVTETNVRRVMWWFCYGIILFMMISIGYGIKRSLEFDDWNYITYGHLGMEIFHPTYAAVYQCFVLGFMMLSATKGEFIFGNRKLHYGIMFFIPVYVSLLASKAGLLSILIVIAWCAWKWWRARSGWKSIALVCGILSVISITSALITPASSRRISSAVDSPAAIRADEKKIAHNSTELRWVAWSASWQLLKQNPVGVGTGDSTPELVKVYDQMGEDYAAKKNLNSHNQFLQLGVELGWPCLIVLVMLLLLLIVHSIRKRNHLAQLFLLLCIFNFLFESFLEVQSGIVFFCFWAMLFVKQADAETL